MSKEKKSEKKATVERRVQKSRRVVKMNQPWTHGQQTLESRIWLKLADHQEKTKFVGESVGTRSHELSFDVKAAGREDDGK